MAETELQIVARMRDRMSPAIRRLQQGFARLTRGVGGVIRRLTSFRTALIGALGGGALVAGTKAIAQQGRELDLWSRKLGTSAEELSSLSAAAELAGFDFDILREGLKTLQERMDDAGRGNATYQEQFARLGVEIRDAGGNLRNVVDILPEISAGFERVAASGGAQDLVLITEDLIGGSENLLSVWLSEGPAAMQALIDRARELGFALDSTFTFRSTRFSQAFNELQQSLLATAQQLFTTLEPYLTAGARLIGEWVRSFRDMDVTLQDVLDVIDDIFRFVVGGLASGFELFFRLVANIAEVVENVATQIVNLGAVIRRELLGALSAVASAVADILRLVDRTGALGLAGEALDAFGAGAGSAAEELDKISIAFRTASDAASTMRDPVDLGSKAVRDLQQTTKELIKSIDEQGIAVLGSIPGFSRYAQILREVQDEIAGVTSGGQGRGNQATGLDQFFNSFAGQMRQAQSQWRDFAQAGVAAASAITSTIENGLVDAISDAILGLQSWKDAFEAFGELVVAELIRIIVRLVVVQTLAAAVDSIFGFGSFAALNAGLSIGSGNAPSTPGVAPGTAAPESFGGRPDLGVAELRAPARAASGGAPIVVNVNTPVQSTASGPEVVAAIRSSRTAVAVELEEIVRTTMGGRRAVSRRFG